MTTGLQLIQVRERKAFKSPQPDLVGCTSAATISSNSQQLIHGAVLLLYYWIVQEWCTAWQRALRLAVVLVLGIRGVVVNVACIQ